MHRFADNNLTPDIFRTNIRLFYFTIFLRYIQLTTCVCIFITSPIFKGYLEVIKCEHPEVETGFAPLETTTEIVVTDPHDHDHHVLTTPIDPPKDAKVKAH